MPMTTNDEQSDESFTSARLCDAHQAIARDLERSAMSTGDLDVLALVSDCAEGHRIAAREMSDAPGKIHLRPKAISEIVRPLRNGTVHAAASDPFTLMINVERIEQRTARLLAQCAETVDSAALRAALNEHADRFARSARSISDRRETMQSSRAVQPMRPPSIER